MAWLATSEARVTPKIEFPRVIISTNVTTMVWPKGLSHTPLRLSTLNLYPTTRMQPLITRSSRCRRTRWWLNIAKNFFLDYFLPHFPPCCWLASRSVNLAFLMFLFSTFACLFFYFSTYFIYTNNWEISMSLFNIAPLYSNSKTSERLT